MLDATTNTPDIVAPAAAEKKAEKKKAEPRATHVIDVPAGTVTVKEPDGSSVVFTIAEVPASLHPYLALAGLRNVMRQAAKPEEMWANLRAGKSPAREPGAAPRRELSDKRLAIVAAKMEAAKKAGEPMTEESAKEWVAKLPRDEVEKRMMHPRVVFHYNKKMGTDPIL